MEKGREYNLFLMLMVFIILNLIRATKLENRLSKLKNREAQERDAVESCELIINGYLLEGSKAMIRICLNRAEPALTHEDGLADAVKSHSMILQALL